MQVNQFENCNKEKMEASKTGTIPEANHTKF